MFLASSTGRFQMYFFVPCLLRDGENEELERENTIVLPKMRRLASFDEQMLDCDVIHQT